MLNQCILVGKVIGSVSASERKIIIQIKRNNSELDDYDYIEVDLGVIYKSVIGYVKEGSTIGIKAKLVSDDTTNLSVLAEKITFINVADKESDE